MELFALASLAVVAGVVSFSSPCVLPLLPGYVSYISGLGGAASPGESHRRTVLGASLFVLGFAAVFTALGATATALGLLRARRPSGRGGAAPTTASTSPTASARPSWPPWPVA